VNTPFYGVLLKKPDAKEALLRGLDEVERMLDTDYFAGE